MRKSRQPKIQQNKTTLYGSVASYNTRPGNEVGLFYNAPEPTRGDFCDGHTVATVLAARGRIAAALASALRLRAVAHIVKVVVSKKWCCKIDTPLLGSIIWLIYFQ